MFGISEGKDPVQLQPPAVAKILNKHRNKERFFIFLNINFLYDHFANNLPAPFIGNGMREGGGGERGQVDPDDWLGSAFVLVSRTLGMF